MDSGGFLRIVEVLGQCQRFSGRNESLARFGAGCDAGRGADGGPPLVRAFCRANFQRLRPGGVFKLYETGLCHNHTMPDKTYPDEHRAVLIGYEPRDVQVICYEPDGASLWLIPPATLKSLIHSIDSDDLVFSCWWDFHREHPKEKELASYPLQPQLEMNVLPDQLKAVLNGSSNSIYIEKFYPQYLRVPRSGDVHALEASDVYVSGNLTLKRESGHTWWSFNRDSSLARNCGSIIGPAAIIIYEEVPRKGLLSETLNRFTIRSLYITFVLSVGRFIRMQFADIRMRIPYKIFHACDRCCAFNRFSCVL